ncbi:hypothetical protein BS47DRAFT_927499 [Hydnum rufescens UP504]|uniref:Uncharacterized protein n=1 Tax=Hydnum rufescens UP504 TaxID=1448309 RepID=A0A9P6B9A4_9AGAM|nr:hypothetical protein BS47DRAFT_927499 [Hydnum rufescens UP504]
MAGDPFCEIALNPQSGLRPLLDAHVTHASPYHEPGAGGHHYVVVRIRSPKGELAQIRSLWLRCQRKPRASMPPLHKLLKGNREIPAVDSVKLCSDERRLRNTATDSVISSSRFQNVQVKHLLPLLGIIHSVSASYGLFWVVFPHYCRHSESSGRRLGQPNKTWPLEDIIYGFKIWYRQEHP